MAELDPQFYDQLANRLDRQDSQLDRIEQNQFIVLRGIEEQKASHLTHLASDSTNFKWLTWVLGGVWAAIGGIITFLVRH